jgi:hypothetical protein
MRNCFAVADWQRKKQGALFTEGEKRSLQLMHDANAFWFRSRLEPKRWVFTQAEQAGRRPGSGRRLKAHRCQAGHRRC